MADVEDSAIDGAGPSEPRFGYNEPSGGSPVSRDPPLVLSKAAAEDKSVGLGSVPPHSIELSGPNSSPPTSGTRSVGASFRDNAEGAETLARALSTAIKEEIERLEDKRRNEPEWQAQIDFLKFVSASLEQIATAIGEARRSATPEDREQKFNRAETLAKSLAGACRNFAERNYERVLDYAGFSAFTVLGTLLFTQLFGVSPEVALAGQLALLGLSRTPK
jgi:hypothetical protein